VFIGGVSFGFAGFAFALFANAALALAVAPTLAVPAVMLLADVLTATLLWEHRREVTVALLKETPAFARASPVLLIAGVGTGTALLGAVPTSTGRLALAAAVLVFVAWQIRPRHRHGAERRASPAAVEATTFAGGLLDGWLGTGGVAVALHLTWRRLPPGRFVAVILPYFLASDVLRAVAYAVAGYWSRATLGVCLDAAPFAVAGYVGGFVLRRRFRSPVLFRAVVLTLLALYGVALVVRAVAGRLA
jgi:hypothetical protein